MAAAARTLSPVSVSLVFVRLFVRLLVQHRHDGAGFTMGADGTRDKRTVKPAKKTMQNQTQIASVRCCAPLERTIGLLRARAHFGTVAIGASVRAN